MQCVPVPNLLSLSLTTLLRNKTDNTLCSRYKQYNRYRQTSKKQKKVCYILTRMSPLRLSHSFVFILKALSIYQLMDFFLMAT